jgi:hypothetical protein
MPVTELPLKDGGRTAVASAASRPAGKANYVAPTSARNDVIISRNCSDCR